MGIYEKCLSITKNTQNDNSKNHTLFPTSNTNNLTMPSVLIPQNNNIDTWTNKHIFYISDIHLAHQVIKKFKQKVNDNCISCYIKEIAQKLFTTNLTESIHSFGTTFIIFGGDISSNFELAKTFYTEFMKQLSTINNRSEYYVYAILGNHEFWDFETTIDCFDTYEELFNQLGICFLQNTITWFGKHEVPLKPVKNENGTTQCYVELKKEENPHEYEQQMRYIHNTLIVGGVGFAGYNNKFNANMRIYQTALNREQEIAETQKWKRTYQEALNIAEKNNSILIVLSHNPISDWNPDIPKNNGCVYFTGHTHKNYLYHDEERDIHIFANNQIGHNNKNIQFKEAYIYNRTNPFAGYNDGYYEITSAKYIQFYDYMNEHIQGNGLVEHQIQTNGAKFYMIKHKGYYGFFMVAPKGTYICSGGRIKKISKSTDIKQFDTDFLDMVEKYLKILSPYRNAQEQIAKIVKSFGGEGKIHGCIIDIDFFNHIMLNPSDGSMTYYYSPIFGMVQTYNNLLNLLDDHNKILAEQYRKQLKSADSEQISEKQIACITDIVKIDIKNSVYAVSNRINQIQRLFDKKILRDWNDELLLRDINNNANALPMK